LGFAEDGSEHAWYFAELFEGVAIMLFERDAVEFEQTGPVIFFRNDGGLVLWRLRSRVC
jgi:hypothetical protein